MLQWIDSIMSTRADRDRFNAALITQEKYGYTPLLIYIDKEITIDIEMLKILSKNPKALDILSFKGKSPLSMLKAQRPGNYREALDLLKTDFAKKHHKAFVSRKALGHAWSLEGVTQLVEAKTKQQKEVDILGHFSQEWYHLMGKTLPDFGKRYPNLLSDDQTKLLNNIFDIGANDHQYSNKAKLKKIQNGDPVVLNAGHEGHAVAILVWGDQFVICDRADISNQPLGIYHFDHKKINAAILQEIETIKNSATEDEYVDYFNTELPKKLGFYKTPLDTKMQEAHPLPMQTVGNCSFASSSAMPYAFLLLGAARGMDTHGHLLAREELSPETLRNINTKYQTWLSHLQLSVLEKHLRPLEKGEQDYLPDHGLIFSTFRKARLLPLDKDGQKRLNELSKIYRNYVAKTGGKLDKAKLAADVAYWENLNKSIAVT